MRSLFVLALVLANLAASTFAHAEAQRWRSKHYDKQLVARHKHPLGGKKVAHECVSEYRIEGKKLSGQRKHTKGHVSLIRTYTPDKKGTHVLEQLLVSPFPHNATLEQKAKLTLLQTLEAVSFAHVDQPTRTELYRDALRGMLNASDRYTRYIPPAERKRDEQIESNEYVGIGVELGLRAHQKSGAVSVRFERVLRGGPAYRAGARNGDFLVAIDGKRLDDVLGDTNKLAGTAGSSVRLTVARDGKHIDLTAERAAVDFNRVQKRLTKDGIGTMRLEDFDDIAETRVVEAIEALEKRNAEQHGQKGKKALRGLVLDLRGNSGGNVLQTALPLLRRFVGGAKRDLFAMRGPTSDMAFQSDPALATYANLPLTILVNEKSASASELFAGSLQELGRAKVIGKKTFGKGSMQTLLPLPDGGRLALTTDRYYFPSGKTPDKVGVQPDITADQAKARFDRKAGDRRTIVDYVHEQALSVLRGEAR
jgi:carboxyl-terminal processing protease